MNRVASCFTLLTGILWLFGVAFMFLALGGITTPISRTSFIFGILIWFSGPATLTAGSVMFLLGKLPKVSIAFLAVASLGLTCIVGSTIYSVLHPQPLEAPPAYSFFAFIAVMTVVCDLCVVQLFVSHTRKSQALGESQ